MNKPNNFEELLQAITPDAYANLKTAVELGKWPDGRVLSREQKENCMQMIIAYELKHLPAEQRTGYVPPKPHQHCEGDGEVAEPVDQPLKWH